MITGGRFFYNRLSLAIEGANYLHTVEFSVANNTNNMYGILKLTLTPKMGLGLVDL